MKSGPHGRIAAGPRISNDMRRDHLDFSGNGSDIDFETNCGSMSTTDISNDAWGEIMYAMDGMATVADDGMDARPRLPSGLEQEPALGAHLTTSRRGYTHHGMYVGHGRVVHYSGFSGFWQCGPVEEVSLSRFAVGRPVQIVDHDRTPFSPEEIVRRSRSRIGENEYRLLTNNCEHFCNWCVCGVSRSAQVERRWQLPFLALLALFHT
jgi:hypothetical protein